MTILMTQGERNQGKKTLATVLTGALTFGLVMSPRSHHDPLYVTVATVPDETPDQPHGHSENNSDAPTLMSRIADGMFANVTATATTTYTLPNL